MSSPPASRTIDHHKDSKLGNMEERTRMLNGKNENSKCCVIKNELALTLLTRLVFLLMILANIGVVATSISYMLDCRENFSNVRTLVPHNTNFCTNLGMPALFACCISLFTIFGLGCTGRRLTGYALIIISSVEILQSLTSITFYQCDFMDRVEIIAAINSSLTPCDINGWLPPSDLRPRPQMDPIYSIRPVSYIDFSHSRGTNLTPAEHKALNKVKAGYSKPPKITRAVDEVRQVHSEDISFSRERGRLNRKHSGSIREVAEVGILSTSEVQESSDASPALAVHPFSQGIQCNVHSLYFKQLATLLKQDALDKCVRMCQTYQVMCGAENKDLHDGSDLARTNRIYMKTTFSYDSKERRVNNTFHESIMSDYHLRSTREHSSNLDREEGTLRRTTKKVVSTSGQAACANTLHREMSQLCRYDNEIILPLSLCAPLLNILLSASFIYLAHCDRNLKQNVSQDSAFLKQSTNSGLHSWAWPFTTLFTKDSCAVVSSYNGIGSIPACLNCCTIIIAEHTTSVSQQALSDFPSPSEERFQLRSFSPIAPRPSV